ncbi:MAG: tetratricopeptide repeat protein, partial [Phycisphaerales bacterium JB050]
ENYAQTALDLGRRMRERHHQTYRALSILGRIAMSRGDYQQAAAYVREEVSMRTQQFGGDHPSTITARGNLATVLGRSGLLDEAESELRIVHAKQVEFRGADNPVTLSVLYNLASTLRKQEDYQEAAAMFHDVFAGRAEHFGLAHPQTLQALRYHILCLRSLGQQEQAFQTLHAYMQEVEEAGGVSPAGSPLAPDLALLAARTERHELALSLSTAVAGDRELPAEAKEMVLFIPGESLVAMGQFAEAEEVYLDLNRELRSREPSDPRQTERLRMRMVDLYRVWYEQSNEPRHLERAEQWENRVLEPSSPAEAP